MSDQNPYLLNSVGNALSIIDLLTKYDELTAQEVAQYMKIGKSTAFRLLSTLANHHFVTKTKDSRYRLSFKLAAIGAVVTDRIELTHIAHPFLQELSRATEETSHLVMWADDTYIQFIDKVLGHSIFRMQSLVGVRLPAHITATGKVLLAHESQEFIQRYIEATSFEPYTPYSITEPQELLKILERVRIDKYGADLDESEEGLTCYAAPIYNTNGAIMAAISASGPTERMRRNADSIIKNVKRIAGVISTELK
ncbi:MAG: IclR family transcriptional regulator [Clostridiales bacterium]|jgi:DNA-binding IclR family transcriptional regulator|nr:IclR family transcriptional regulator [Clostridiales bacterium]